MLRRLDLSGKLAPADKPRISNVERALAACTSAERASVLAGRGEHAAAAEKLRDLAPKDPNNLYNVVCAFAQCVRAVAHEKKPEDLTDDDKVAQARYTGRPLEALAVAIDLGCKDRDRIERGPELDPVRQNPKYKELIERLNARK